MLAGGAAGERVEGDEQGGAVLGGEVPADADLVADGGHVQPAGRRAGGGAGVGGVFQVQLGAQGDGGVGELGAAGLAGQRLEHVAGVAAVLGGEGGHEVAQVVGQVGPQAAGGDVGGDTGHAVPRGGPADLAAAPGGAGAGGVGQPRRRGEAAALGDEVTGDGGTGRGGEQAGDLVGQGDEALHAGEQHLRRQGVGVHGRARDGGRQPVQRRLRGGQHPRAVHPRHRPVHLLHRRLLGGFLRPQPGQQVPVPVLEVLRLRRLPRLPVRRTLQPRVHVNGAGCCRVVPHVRPLPVVFERE